MTAPLARCYFRSLTMGPGRSQKQQALVTSPRSLLQRITVATSERRLTVATATGPAFQRPNIVTKSSKFSPTPLSKMTTDDVKNSYCPQPTRVNRGRREFFNSVQFDWSWQNLTPYCSLFNFHSRNGQMVSFDHYYYNRSCLPATQSSNERRNVGGVLLLGIRIVTPKSRCPLLPDQTRLSITQCSSGYEVIDPLLL
jgi:hypothetical protein